MKSNEVRRGNLVTYEDRIFEIDCISEELPSLNTDEFGIGVVDWEDLKAVPITEDIILQFGATGHESSILNSYEFDLSHFKNEYKVLSIRIQKNNQYVCIQNGVLSKERHEDAIIIIFNSDINGELFAHYIQNLYFVLSGKELTTKQKNRK